MKKYSIINPDPSLRRNLMAFGFECDEGWYPLIFELLDKIQETVDANPNYADMEVTQVKEKFGTLRVYMNYEPDEIFDLIQEYQKKSEATCEVCGKLGELRELKYRWLKTLCEKCYKYREK